MGMNQDRRERALYRRENRKPRAGKPQIVRREGRLTAAVKEEEKPAPQKARHVIIWIGKLRFHLTDDEAIKLVKDIYQQTTRRI